MGELYVNEFFGDLGVNTRRDECSAPLAFYSLDAALDKISDLFLPHEDIFKLWNEMDDVYEISRRTPDPEDDRIVVWKVDPGATPSVSVRLRTIASQLIVRWVLKMYQFIMILVLLIFSLFLRRTIRNFIYRFDEKQFPELILDD
jgi:hypothetical protein